MAFEACTVCWECKCECPIKREKLTASVCAVNLKTPTDEVLGLLEQELDHTTILDKRKCCISLGGIKRAGLAASLKARQLCVRFSFLQLLLYCCCCLKKKKKNRQKRARNFQIKLIVNLLDQIFFRINETWTIVAFSTTLSPFCILLFLS